MAGRKVLWVLYGVGILGTATFGILLARRRSQLGVSQMGFGDVGLAPPAPRRARELEDYPFDPWAPEAEKKRLAQMFLKSRGKEAQSLAPAELPRHVYPYGDFMARQAGRDITGRDVVKAYLLTVGSVQRGAICATVDKKAKCKHDSVGSNPNTGEPRWPSHPFKTTRVRPEDALGALLKTSAGQRYLDAAARGKFDAKAASTLTKRFSGWGFHNKFAEQLRLAPKLGAEAGEINRLLKTGTKPAWYRYVEKNVPGISLAKSGFFASMMGRGDIPTADARELAFWMCPPGHWEPGKRACKFPLSQSHDVSSEFVDRPFMALFTKRMQQLRMDMPPRFKPFYEHLAHHALWDAVGDTKTTHAEIIEAMESA